MSVIIGTANLVSPTGTAAFDLTPYHDTRVGVLVTGNFGGGFLRFLGGVIGAGGIAMQAVDAGAVTASVKTTTAEGLYFLSGPNHRLQLTLQSGTGFDIDLVVFIGSRP